MHAQVLGIKYLHSKDIVHHDIKPENILVTGSGHCIVTDYGGVQFAAHNTLLRDPAEDVIYTPEYAAPELREPARFQQYDNTVDWFSLGVLLAAMVIVTDDEVRVFVCSAVMGC